MLDVGLPDLVKEDPYAIVLLQVVQEDELDAFSQESAQTQRANRRTTWRDPRRDGPLMKAVYGLQIPAFKVSLALKDERPNI
jgi:hypothetical protein